LGLTSGQEVTLPSGAKVTGYTDAYGVYAYEALKFGEAPRFEPPTLYDYPADATIVANNSFLPLIHSCPYVGLDQKLAGLEDCLYTRVFTPVAAGTYSVMQYLYSGGFTMYYPFALMTVPGSLVKEGVVVVIPNYRTNVLGFWNGNFGIQDQILGLKWTQKNIGAFGGDKSSVTIFGTSAGGVSAWILANTPAAKGLFHRAIAQSPGFQDPSQFQYPAAKAWESMGKPCQDAVNCTDAACMKTVPLDTLVWACINYNVWSTFVGQPLVFSGYDGAAVSGSPYEAVCDGTSIEVPILTGACKHEWTMWEYGFQVPSAGVVKNWLSDKVSGATGDKLTCVYDKAMAVYNKSYGAAMPSIAAAGEMEFGFGAMMYAKSKGAPRYRYFLDVDDNGATFPSQHCCEMPYLFAPPAYRADQYETHVPGLDWGGKDVKVEEKKKLAKIIPEYWTSFAKTGVPTSATAGTEWKAYSDDASIMHMTLSSGVSMKKGEQFGEESADMFMDLNCKGGSTFAAECLADPAPEPAPAPAPAPATTEAPGTASNTIRSGMASGLFVFAWYAITLYHA